LTGKSSLVSALFRLTEKCGGRLDVDGVDISQVGLEQLRSRLSIITQDPVLFSGTIRYFPSTKRGFSLSSFSIAYFVIYSVVRNPILSLNCRESCCKLANEDISSL